MGQITTIAGREIHTDYTLRDFAKFLIVTSIPVAFLLYGSVLYIESFLFPAMEGFVLNMEITKEWLETEVESYVAELKNEHIPNQAAIESMTPEKAMDFVEEVEIKKMEVSDITEQIALSWLSMGMGVLVPLYIVWRIHGFIWRLLERVRFLRVAHYKRMLYVIDRR